MHDSAIYCSSYFTLNSVARVIKQISLVLVHNNLSISLLSYLATLTFICEMAPPSFQIAIYGLLNSEQYQLAKHCLEDLKRSHRNQLIQPEFHPFLEYEWNTFLRKKRAELRGETWAFDDPCMVFIDDKLLGNDQEFLAWAKANFAHTDFRDKELVHVLSQEEYQ